MPKRQVKSIEITNKEINSLQNITVNNASFSTQLTKYLTTWIAIELENYQKVHGDVPKKELYQTYTDTQAAAKGGRKIPQEKTDKKDGSKKTVEVSPKAYFTNLGNLKTLLNYFLLKYTLELRHIFVENDYEFDRNYNETELEKDAFELVLNPLIPFVLNIAKRFENKACDYTVHFDGVQSIKQIFKTQDGGQASTKKLDQFLTRFFEFVNVFIIQIFTISFPHKSLLHLDYIIGLLDVFNQSADASALGEDVLQDLANYLKHAIKKPVKGTGKKTGKAAKKAAPKKDDDEEEEESSSSDGDEIVEEAVYSDL
jgi:hypothetical protein